MKTKISKILGVGLAFLMVCGLAFALTPAEKTKAEAYLPNQWNAMVVPSPAGNVIVATSDILDYDVASDGLTIYAVGIGVTASGIAKSTNGGKTWASLAAPTLPAPTPPFKLVAVAPDDPNCVAIVASGAQQHVWYSKNGGASWSALTVAPTAWAAMTVTDIDISPTREDALLMRDIAVSAATGASTGGIFLTSSTTWEDLSIAPQVLPIYDYYSIKFEPNWIGGMSIAAVAFDGIVTVPPGPRFVVYRAAPWAPGIANSCNVAITAPSFPNPVPIPAQMVGGYASITLPADFDSTNPMAMVAYIGFSSTALVGTTTEDVFRMDYLTARKLDIAGSQKIQSVSFVGTISGGTLYCAGPMFVGVGWASWVWSTTNPQSNTPTWGPTAKGPTGPLAAVATPNAGYAKVIMDPNYATSNTAFCSTATVAGAAADESAFSVTGFLGGMSFNQISFIDTTSMGALWDVMPTPDNSTIFLSSCATAGPPPTAPSSLWKCSTYPPAVGSWVRVGFQALAGMVIRLSPDYLTDSTLYWADTGPGPAPANTMIQVSNLGGEIWASRTAPIGLNNFADLCVESKSVVYMASGTTVRKSTNGAWYFNAAVSTPTTGVRTLAMAPTYPEKPVAGNLLVGGVAGEVAMSKDSAASFFPLGAGIAGGGWMQLAADKDYATNNNVYAAGTGVNGVFRFEVGISNAWENILTPPAFSPFTGLATESGTLYAGMVNGQVWRTLMPTLPDIAGLLWDRMDINPTAGFTAVPSALRAAGNATDTYLWAVIPGAVTLMNYDDTMAKAVVTPVVDPNIPNDPLTGRNLDFIITWNKPSNALWYNVGIYTDAACTQLKWAPGAGFTVGVVGGPPVSLPVYLPSMPLAPSLNVPNGVLAGGMKYYVMIFVGDQAPGDQIRSNAAKATVVSFTIAAGGPISSPYAGPQLLSPTPGAQDVDPACSFSWGPVSLATKYQVIIATDAALTQTIAGTPAFTTEPAFGPVTLEYDTDYWYAVKVVEPSESAQAVGGFHTAEAATYTCGICGLVFDSQADLEAHLATAHAPVEPSTPMYIWIVIAVGAVLVIAVIWLIVTTRRP